MFMSVPNDKIEIDFPFRVPLPEGWRLLYYKKNCCVIRDPKGQVWQKFLVGSNPTPKNVRSVSCSRCRNKLKRFHATCLKCRRKKAAEGRIPKMIRVQPYTLLILKDRPLAKIKDRLLKAVLTLVEIFLTN